MSPPLFALETNVSEQKKATVNLLPCRIHHDGDVNSSRIFWNPTKGQDNSQTCYLRGRKLQGKAVNLPEGYHGVVVEKTDEKPETSTEQETLEDVEMIENPDDQLEVGTMKAKAGFDELMIWDHESVSESTADPYVRGMSEWITFAEEIHSYQSTSGPGSSKK